MPIKFKCQHIFTSQLQYQLSKWLPEQIEYECECECLCEPGIKSAAGCNEELRSLLCFVQARNQERA